MVTTQIGTEGKRASIKQDIMSLYSALRVGGAFDDKDIINDGSRNLMVKSYAQGQNSQQGFKTKMAEAQTEFQMANTPGKITTRYYSSIYGQLSTVKYGDIPKS